MKVLVVTNMYPTHDQPAFGTFVKDQVDSLRQTGLEVDVLFVDGRKSKWNYLWGIPRFWWAVLSEQYDIIHAHYAISGLIARLQFRYPVVVTYHGAEVSDYAPAWLKFLARRGHWLFDRVIVVSQREKESMVDPNDRVYIIPGGVDFGVFRPLSTTEARMQLDLPMDKPLVLWAGEHWQFEKRFELVEESMKVLRQRCPEAELVLVSGKPHSAIPAYMNACDVLLLTSRSEGSPTVVKEAMACNLPVVSTDVGDVAEVIGATEGCFLVEPDAQDIAETLLHVLHQRQRTQGREKIHHLRSEAIVRRVVAVYKTLRSPDHRVELAKN